MRLAGGPLPGWAWLPVFETSRGRLLICATIPVRRRHSSSGPWITVRAAESRLTLGMLGMLCLR